MKVGDKTKSLSVKYVLYSHYGRSDSDDFKAWGKGKAIADLEGVKYLKNHLNGLHELLTSPAYEGMLVLFYAPGFAKCLDVLSDIRKGKREKIMALAKIEELKFANEVRRYLDAEFQKKEEELAKRVRFITPTDLFDVFGRMTWRIESLRGWFYGFRDPLRYDTPKIVEAIVRLRLLGTGVPLFRLDHDVLFHENNGDDKNVADLGLFKQVVSCLRAYRVRVEEASIATFLFSASYDMRGLMHPAKKDDFQAWRGAFATRIFPALPVLNDVKVAEKKEKPIREMKKANKDAFDKLDDSEKYPFEKMYADKKDKVFKESLARKFYGFSDSKIKTPNVEGIGKIGAHPTVSVISGAMLCLSDGAILDLPPFSNFSLNVVWIDDHLKYCLHRELRHLTTKELAIEPLLSDAKLDRIMVQKDRGKIDNLPSYVLGSYLPSLLWGTVMDAWITPNPLIKFRPDDLSKKDRILWGQISPKGQSKAILASAMHNALNAHGISPSEKQQLKEKLVTAALERITVVRKQWAGLTLIGSSGDETETFASIWAKGKVRNFFPELEGACLGITTIPDLPLKTNVTINNMNDTLKEELRVLADHAADYIEWTIAWPEIVQVIRSVEQGTLRTDLSWYAQ